MARSPSLPGLTLSIRINNRKLPEYRDTDIEDPPRVISYMIEAIPDTIFSIHALASPSAVFTGSSLALYFYIDGKERQIELVETVSTSLSSRPRTSARSSATPNVSYAGRENSPLDPLAMGDTSDLLSMGSKSYPSAATRLSDDANANDSVAGAAVRSSVAVSRGEDCCSTTRREVWRSCAITDPVPAPIEGELDVPMRPAMLNSDAESNEEEASTVPGRDLGFAEHKSPHPDSASRSAPVSTNFFSGYRSTERRPSGMVLPRRSVIAKTSFDEFDTPRPEAATAPPSDQTSNKSSLNATVGSDFTAPEELGTIKIIVTHVNKKEAVAFGRNASTTAQIGDKAQEAVKDKSGGLLVRFTAPQTVSPITTWDVGAVNDDEDTSVTYVYHYRTREMLDALGVLPQEVKEERVGQSGISETKFDHYGSEMTPDGNSRLKGKMCERNEMDGSWQKLSASGEIEIKEEGLSRRRSITKNGALGDDDWEMVDEDNA